MSETFLASIAGTGFMVAFLHAAIPTHWLPFVLAARGQGWGSGKTLTVTAFAGAGHVALTAVLGALVVWLGIALDQWTGRIFPWIAGGALVTFGIFYVVRQARGGSGHLHWGGGHQAHGHHDQAHDHAHDHAHAAPGPAGLVRKSDWAVVLGLFALLTFSPCEGFLPVYLSGIAYGWVGFLLLSAILAAATLAGMMAFTWLTLAGMEKLRLEFVERYESGVLGSLLVLLGLAVILFER